MSKYLNIRMMGENLGKNYLIYFALKNEKNYRNKTNITYINKGMVNTD